MQRWNVLLETDVVETLLVIGAGGHGKVVADAAMEMGRWSRIGFVDDRYGDLQRVAGVQVVGSLAELRSLRNEWSAAVVALGDARRRLEIMNDVRQFKFELPVICHPSAVLSRLVTVGAGTVILSQVAINADTSIGAGCIVNTGATVDHDCQLDDGVHVCPGVSLAGNVRIGARSWIGIGSTVRQAISIGRDVLIGAGSVVVRDVPDAVTAYGVPARVRSKSSATE